MDKNDESLAATVPKGDGTEVRSGITADHISADYLIQQYGDQAYHEGCKLAVVALQLGDRTMTRALAKANIELLQRGYHKKPKAYMLELTGDELDALRRAVRRAWGTLRPGASPIDADEQKLLVAIRHKLIELKEDATAHPEAERGATGQANTKSKEGPE
jgi:hypothetical protein